MTLKYESELIKDIVDTRGHGKSSLHYESECIGAWIEETKGAYPKLCDYESEWLNYINANEIGKFPYETVTANPTATVNNVVPYSYTSAILKGNTKYRDIDTGEILETFEEGRNLELVSVKMPVLTTTGKNLFNCTNVEDINNSYTVVNMNNQNYITTDTLVEKGKQYILSLHANISGATGNVLYLGYMNYSNIDGGVDKARHNILTIDSMVDKTTSITFTAQTTDYIKIYIASGKVGYNVVLSNVQIEEGLTATTYEPYKSNILTVNEEVELRGIGEVKDELDLLTGEVAQNIGEIVLDGSESWAEYTSQELTNTRLFYCKVPTNSNINTSKSTMINNRFASLSPNSGGLWNTDVVGLGNSVVINAFRLRVLKSTANTINELKEYLHSNPIVVQYELAEKSVKTVELTVVNQDNETLTKIKPIEGTMNINVTGNPINPIGVFEVSVEAITQNLGSFIEEE